MTPEAINQAMAELDGWTHHKHDSHLFYQECWTIGAHRDCLPRVWRPSDLPNYTQDLNAVARVVPKLAALQVYRYKQALKRMRGGYYFKAIDATALQRCEAILRAVGKWVEG